MPCRLCGASDLVLPILIWIPPLLDDSSEAHLHPHGVMVPLAQARAGACRGPAVDAGPAGVRARAAARVRGRAAGRAGRAGARAEPAAARRGAGLLRVKRLVEGGFMS